MKLTVGARMPDFSFQTPEGTVESFLGTLTGKGTLLLFHRFAGCRLCRLAAWEARESWEALKKEGWQVMLAVQSPAERAGDIAGEGGLPFPVICDPEGELYRKFEILPAASQEAVGDPAVIAERVARAESLGLSAGVKEGEGLQLPALFAVDAGGTVRYVHYGKSYYDLPGLEEAVRQTEG